MIETFILVIVFGMGFWFIFSPLFLSEEVIDEEDSFTPFVSGEDLFLRKENVLSALRDLRLDHATHKISQEDFEQMENEVLKDGAHVLRQMDQK